MELTPYLCTTHKQPIWAVLFDSESQQQIIEDSVLKCISCFGEQQINMKDLISFSELQNSSNASFKRMPLNLTQKAQLNDFKKKYSSQKLAQTRQQIKDFFSNFLKEVSEKMQSLEKEALMRLDRNQQILQCFLQPDYFQILKQNILSAIIAGNGNSTKLNEEIRSLIQTYKAESAERFKRIDQDLAELTEKLFLFSEVKSHAQKEMILEQMQQIEKFLQIEGNHFEEFELIRSGLGDSGQAIISRNEDGELMFKNPKEGRIFAYSNLIIEPKLRYLITVEIHSQTQQNWHQLIGLMEDKLKNNKFLWETKLAFSNYSVVNGLQRKNNWECFILEELDNVERFEWQISLCLEEKRFVVSDFPERNIIYLLDKETIEDKIYRLGVELENAEDSITIKNIEIVKLFPGII